MNKTYETIVFQRNLGLAIQQMRHLIESRQLTQFIEPLNEIQADHSRILEFMLSGFADPSRNQLYTALLRQLFRLRTEIILTLSRRTESLSSPSPYPSRSSPTTTCAATWKPSCKTSPSCRSRPTASPVRKTFIKVITN